MNRLAGLAAVVGPLILGACTPQGEPSLARGVCGDRETVAKAMDEAGETVEAMGLNRRAAETFTFYRGPQSWTVVQGNRFGAHCIIAAGDDWRAR